MLRSVALRTFVTAILSLPFVAAPIKIGFATMPQDAQPKPEEKTYTAEQLENELMFLYDWTFKAFKLKGVIDAMSADATKSSDVRRISDLDTFPPS